MKKVLVLLFFTLFFGNVACAYVGMNDSTIADAQEYGMMNYQKDLPLFAMPWAVFEENSKSLDEFGEKVYIYTPYYLVAVNARERLLASQTINIVDGRVIADAFADALPVCIVLYVKDVSDIQNSVVALMRQKGELLEAYAMEIQDVAVVQTMVVQEEVIPVEIKVDETGASGQTDAVKEEEVKTAGTKEDVKEKEQDDKDKKKDKKKSDEGDEGGRKDDAKETVAPVEVKPEPVFIEKVVPSLHRVQLFVYFDKRGLQLSGQATLVVDLKNEHERRFNFSFDSIR